MKKIQFAVVGFLLAAGVASAAVVWLDDFTAYSDFNPFNPTLMHDGRDGEWFDLGSANANANREFVLSTGGAGQTRGAVVALNLASAPKVDTTADASFYRFTFDLLSLDANTDYSVEIYSGIRDGGTSPSNSYNIDRGSPAGAELTHAAIGTGSITLITNVTYTSVDIGPGKTIDFEYDGAGDIVLTFEIKTGATFQKWSRTDNMLLSILPEVLPAGTLYYEDFSEWADVDRDGDETYAPPTGTDLGVIATNTLARWYKKEVGISISTTNANVDAPVDATGGAALRAGYHGHNDIWQNNTTINTGIDFDSNTNYTFSFRIKLHASNGTVPVGSETGSVQIATGYWDTTAPSNNMNWTKGENFTNLSSSAWVTNSFTISGARITTNALGYPILMRVTKKGPQNSTGFESWIDWIKIEGENPYADWANSFGGLGSNYVMTSDYDLDGMDDFTEWAMGGNPTNDSDTGLSGNTFIWDNNGTNVFTIVAPNLRWSWLKGVDYYFEGSDDLINGVWTNIWPWEWQPSEVEGFSSEYDAVTNYFSGAATSNDTQFIRLRASHRNYNP